MADIGTTLREARIRARIDISEVEARTKIRAKYLRAIENEEWDLLPGPVYVKSFLRTYGDFLGLDSRLLVDEYKRRYERPADQDMRPITPLGRERERKRRRPPGRLGRVVAVLAVLVAVVVALFLVGSLNPSSPSSTTSSSVTTSAQDRTTSSTSTHTTTVHHHHRRPPPPKPTAVTLKLVPTSTLYVCVEDGHGNKLINGVTYAAGQTIPTETAPKLMVTLGNDSVQMKINGKSVTPTVGSPIGYELTPGKTTPLPAGQLPTCA
jgi:cytoskeleton protein RodZ